MKPCSATNVELIFGKMCEFEKLIDGDGELINVEKTTESASAAEVGELPVAVDARLELLI